MSDEDALWAAIDAMPECQLRRLVLADWLDERAGDGKPCKGVRCGNPEPGYVDNLLGIKGKYRCDECRGTAFEMKWDRELKVYTRVSNGYADLAMALRATADRVPWVKVFKNGFGWWCKRSFHDDIDYLIERKIMNAMSDSQERCDHDDTVRFDKRDGVSGGVILFPTASAAIKDLCRAWVAVHCKSEVLT